MSGKYKNKVTEENGLVALGKLVQKQGKSTDICHFGLCNVGPHSSPLAPILCPSIPEVYWVPFSTASFAAIGTRAEKETEMGFAALRTLIRPLSRTLISRTSTHPATTPFPATLTSPIHRRAPWFPISNHFHSLTDTRFPKRRPTEKPRRKRVSLKPPGSSFSPWEKLLFIFIFCFLFSATK